MKTCKVKPSESACSGCLEIADSFDAIVNCKECSYQTTRYDLIDFVSGFWGTYAIICKPGGMCEKVSIDMIYDIQ